MKKYMVISVADGEQFACFFDTMKEVENHRLSPDYTYKYVG